MKRLAAFLGFLCLVLLLLAFDEGQVKRGVDGVRARLEPAVARVREAAERQPPARPAAGSVVIAGDFIPRDPSAPGGWVHVEGAMLVFERAPPMRTRPHRIAEGRDPPARTLGLPDTHQIELRQVVRPDARTPVAASPLCAGRAPGWIGLARHGGVLDLLVWPAGPTPDVAGVPCGRFSYDGPRR